VVGGECAIWQRRCNSAFDHLPHLAISGFLLSESPGLLSDSETRQKRFSNIGRSYHILWFPYYWRNLRYLQRMSGSVSNEKRTGYLEKLLPIEPIKLEWECCFILWAHPFQTVNPKVKASYIIIASEFCCKNRRLHLAAWRGSGRCETEGLCT